MSAFLASLQACKLAANLLALAPHAQRLLALAAIADALEVQANLPESPLLLANAEDLACAQADGLAPAMLDRLALTPARLRSMAADVRNVAALPDPVMALLDEFTRADGLKIARHRVPLGVLAVIYEARPNVTIDCAALAIKSGNGAVLRGGKESNRSNQALAALVQNALAAAGLPPHCLVVLPAGERAELVDLFSHSDLLTVVIPRGGPGLHRYCKEISRVPVLSGGVGICHLYWHASADAAGALAVVENAKVQRPSVCNALDVLLLDMQIAAQTLPNIVQQLARAGVRFRLCDKAYAIVKSQLEESDPVSFAAVDLAGLEDFATEWLSLTLSIKLVDGPSAAILHIQAHSSGHSDGLLAADPQIWSDFSQQIDSAAIYHNASTRFTDGAELGLGAEIAVSTERLHARGPMGLNELMSSKWIVQGQYHTRR